MTLPGFTKCEPCRGSGAIPAWPGRQWERCPDCEGTGLQPDPAFGDAVAETMHLATPLPSDGPQFWRIEARAALLAYAREVQQPPNL